MLHNCKIVQYLTSNMLYSHFIYNVTSNPRNCDNQPRAGDGCLNTHIINELENTDFPLQCVS